MPMGSGEAEPMLWGLDEAAVTPLNHPSELIVADHQFPIFGYPNMVLDSSPRAYGGVGYSFVGFSV
jgi:hypothetical protein